MENNTTETKTPSLYDRIKVATAQKEPGTVTTPTLKTEPEKKPAQPAPIKKSSQAWNSADDFEEPKKETNSEPATGNITQDKTTPAPKEAPKVTHAMKMASARTAVGMLDLTQKMILRPVVNHKFKKRFTNDEIKRIPDVEEKNKATLSNEDLELRNKLDKWLKKRDQQMKVIPLTPTEEEDLTKLFYNYFDATEQTLPPSYGLAFGVINSLGKRAVDIFID